MAGLSGRLALVFGLLLMLVTGTAAANDIAINEVAIGAAPVEARAGEAPQPP
ncbi:hypothetical protein ACQ86O_23660 [Serratia sp. L9]|uniref:hypothetical protein n=1 Tax=Serratia sp. L9 TaxID=3423946 RepID=UPI003D66D735